MKRMTVNQKASAEIKKYVEEHHIQLCEACHGLKCHNRYMGAAHRHKRRFYYSLPVSALWDRNQWLYLGQDCHEAIEYSKQATEELFNDRIGPDKYFPIK